MTMRWSIVGDMLLIFVTHQVNRNISYPLEIFSQIPVFKYMCFIAITDFLTYVVEIILFDLKTN